MSLERILKLLTISGLMLVPLVPAIVSMNMFFPFVTGKAFTFHALVGLVTAIWLALAFVDANYRPRLSPGLIVVTLFITIIALANFLGVDPARSFWSNFERMEGFVLLWYLFLFFLVSSSMMQEEGRWKMFFHISLLVAVVVSFIGLNQVDEMSRIYASLGNPIYLAAYMIFHIFLALFYLVKLPNWADMRAWFYIPIIPLFTLVLFLTLTRGAMLGLMAGVFVTGLLLVIFERERKNLRRVALTGVVLALLVGGFLSLLVGANHINEEVRPIWLGELNTWARDTPVLYRFARVSVFEGGGAARVKLWQVALEGYSERPILGWGQENYGAIFDRHYDPSLYDRETWFDRAHNVILDWLVTGGVLGLISYLSLFAVAVYLIWRDPNNYWSVAEKSILTGMLVAYFVHNVFVFDNVATYVLFFAVLAFITSRTTTDSGIIVGGERELSVGTVKFILPVTAGLIGLMLYFTTWQPLLVNGALIEALGYANSRENRYEQGWDSFYQALSYSSYLGRQETLERLINATYEVDRRRGSDSSVAGLYRQFTDDEVSLFLDNNPDQARFLFIWGRILNALGRHEEAEEVLSRALNVSPQKQILLFEMSSVLNAQGRHEEALETARKAFELAPAFDEARITYAMALVYSGQDQLVEEILEPLSDSQRLDARLLQPYIDQGRFDEFIEKRQDRINFFRDRLAEAESAERVSELEISIVQEVISIAAAYIEMGLVDAAVAELERAAAEFPSFEPQLQQYIDEIRE